MSNSVVVSKDKNRGSARGGVLNDMNKKFVSLKGLLMIQFRCGTSITKINESS